MKLTIPKKLPLLEGLCWNIVNHKELSPEEMLGIYEERWRFNGVLSAPSQEEIDFIEQLTIQYSGLPLISQNMNKAEFYECINLLLDYLDGDLLTQYGVYLGGGTLIGLKYGQVRASSDLDFLNQSQKYQSLKLAITQQGSTLFFKANPSFDIGSARIDRYGIRFPVTFKLRGQVFSFKIEIVAEYNLDLATPERFKDIPCLNTNDLIAAKLLANADRWADGSKFSRDLIDLAIVVEQQQGLSTLAIEKAEAVYPVINSLIEAIQQFQRFPDRRRQCYEALSVENPVLIINGLDLLAQNFNLDITSREFIEIDFGYLN